MAARVLSFDGFVPIVRVLGLLLVLFAGVVAADAPVRVPNPLSGPGVGELKRSERKKVERGWRALNEGDHAASRKRISRIAALPPARLLDLQIRLREQQPDVVQELTTFCDDHPDYAAAWITLSIAAEAAELEGVALATARHGAALWPSSEWAARAEALSTRWVDDRVTAAAALIDDGQPDEALARIKAALALDPDRRDAAVLKARIHLETGDPIQAEQVLEGFPELPEAVYLRGTIAEERGDWLSAMELFSALPSGYPGRHAAMARAQMRWRLTLLPDYAQTAMSSTAMTRGELAVLLVSLQPRLKTLAGGDVPVMSDIVDYPGQREIITVVRLGIMRSDRRGHLFLPNMKIGAESVRDAVNRARTLLGLDPRTWCATPDMVGSDCHFIESPPRGEDVVRAVLDSMSGAE